MKFSHGEWYTRLSEISRMPFIRTLEVAGLCLGALLLGPTAHATGTGTSLLGKQILVGFYDSASSVGNAANAIDSLLVTVGPGEEITNWFAADAFGNVGAAVNIDLAGITITIKKSNESQNAFISPLFLGISDTLDLLAPFDSETLNDPESTSIAWILSNTSALPALTVNADNIVIDLSQLQLPMASTGNGLLVNIAFDSTTPPTDVPEPNLPALLGLGAALAAWNRRRR